MKIGIIDYGSGNFTSVFNAVNLISKQVKIITSKSHFDECESIILPGVGTFKHAINKLNELNIISSLKREVTEKKKPFLGICVGLQILADRGFEFEETNGLSLITGEVCKFNFNKKEEYLLPHIGWNSVHNFSDNLLFKGINEEESNFYFVNSYHLISSDEGAKFAYSNYGYDFISAFQKENIFGVQFHPEKSQHNGLLLLKNFIQYA